MVLQGGKKRLRVLAFKTNLESKQKKMCQIKSNGERKILRNKSFKEERQLKTRFKEVAKELKAWNQNDWE